MSARAVLAVAGVVAAMLLPTGDFAQSPTVKAVGTVKAVNGNAVTITTDSGTESTVTCADSARIVRATPGQTDLKTAVPIQAADIKVGDRLFARGQPGDNSALLASSVIVMKKGDIAQRQQAEREEWRHGVGGIVKNLDAASEAITIVNSLSASGKQIVVHLSPQTVIRRYAPDSVKFDEAKPGTLDHIKPGDQLRARGTKNGDGTEFTAQAIVSGTFRQIAGTVVSTDAASNAVTILDLVTKKPLVVKVSADSEVRKLPPFVAQRIAMRLKGGSPDSAAAASSSKPESGGAQGGNRSATWQGRGSDANGSNSPGARDAQGAAGGTWRGNGGTPDFQQMISRMPAISVSDLNKGDAVMLVATEGSASSEPTAITLLGGVEPILAAAPGGAGASMILSPWNLGGGEGGGDAQ